MTEFYTCTIYKAKKDHVCHICDGIIHKGEFYEYETGKEGNEFFHRHSHINCAKWRDEYCKNYGFDEYNPEDVIEYMKSKEVRNEG